MMVSTDTTMLRQHYRKQYNDNPELKLLDLPQEIKDMVYGYTSANAISSI
jgi:hypothetical protein